MPLTNRQTHDIAVAKQLYLERVKAGFSTLGAQHLRAYVRKLVSEVGPEILRTDFVSMNQGTMRSLIRQFRGVDAVAQAELKKQLLLLMLTFTDHEIALQAGLWDDEQTAPAPTEEQRSRLQSQVMSRPITNEGRSSDDMIALFLAGLTVSAEGIIQAGMALRQPASEVLAGLQGLDVVKAAALNSVVFTAVQNAAHVVFQWTIGKLSLPKYIWVSVLDERTTDICISLSGRVFIVGKGPVPPAHRRCRSTTSPWIDGRGRVPNFTLGSWLKEQPKSLHNDLTSGKPISLNDYSKKVKAYGTTSKDQ